MAGTRPKAKSDLRVKQGQRRDAYFAALKRASQPKNATQTDAAAPAAKPSATATS